MLGGAAVMPKFVEHHMIAIPRPGWTAEEGPRPCIIVISARDERGQLWIYTDDTGLAPITTQREVSKPKRRR